MKSWIILGILLAAVFAATRLAALQVQFNDSDVNLYARYASEWQAAGRQGVSFYDLHRQRVEDEMRRSTPQQAAALAEYKTVEYPPVAVSLMIVPAWLGCGTSAAEMSEEFRSRYTRAYYWLMAGFDVIVVLLVVFLVRRLFPAATPVEQLERCLTYVICSWPLYGVLYSRLDLGVALLVTAALALLVSRQHWWMSLAALAVAINFKVMPIALAPLWVLASLPVAALQSWREIARGASVRAAVLAVFGLAILAPYYLTHGQAVLEFLNYHRVRGIEIESTWATLLMPARFSGDEWRVVHSHGSVNVQAPLGQTFLAVATPVLAGLLAAAAGLFFAVVWRTGQVEQAESGTIAQRWPRLVAGFALLLLLLSIVANKVFSPQYLIWVLPLVPLVDFRPGPRRLFFAAMFAMCFLTMRIFPDCFVGEIVRVISRDGDMPVFDGPTPFGAWLLATRNALCVLLTFALGATLTRGLIGQRATAESSPTSAEAGSGEVVTAKRSLVIWLE